MKFSYIALLAIPSLAVASVLPRGGGETLCCQRVEYFDGYYGDHHHHHHHHHDHDHHHGHYSIGYGCYRDDFFDFHKNGGCHERVECEYYNSWAKIGYDCYRVDYDWDYKKVAKTDGKAA